MLIDAPAAAVDADNELIVGGDVDAEVIEMLSKTAVQVELRLRSVTPKPIYTLACIVNGKGLAIEFQFTPSLDVKGLMKLPCRTNFNQ